MELKLPIVAVPVRLALVGSGPVEAEVFLPDAPRLGRSQVLDDVAALLEHEAPFMPVRFGRIVKLVAKRAILWLATARYTDSELSDGGIAEDFDDMPSEVVMLFDREHYVDVDLAAGGTLRGALFDSSPKDRQRAIDHLNRPGVFLRLWSDDEHYVVNKAHIRHVSEVERGSL